MLTPSTRRCIPRPAAAGRVALREARTLMSAVHDRPEITFCPGGRSGLSRDGLARLGARFDPISDHLMVHSAATKVWGTPHRKHVTTAGDMAASLVCTIKPARHGTRSVHGPRLASRPPDREPLEFGDGRAERAPGRTWRVPGPWARSVVMGRVPSAKRATSLICRRHVPRINFHCPTCQTSTRKEPDMRPQNLGMTSRGLTCTARWLVGRNTAHKQQFRSPSLGHVRPLVDMSKKSGQRGQWPEAVSSRWPQNRTATVADQ
ncbi:hypothetical protein GGR56DRAFT_436468 [Xylariaceae sp. FL0804]|nr:hypothetical protein GGR56DRAFT_436468 [Xylariaceae sp. FL0804]